MIFIYARQFNVNVKCIHILFNLFDIARLHIKSSIIQLVDYFNYERLYSQLRKLKP